MRIALLGLGKMGTPIARLLLKNGHQLTVWNRTAAAAEPLAAEGAQVAGSPAEAVTGVPVVFTMLSNDAATESVVFGTENRPGILGAMELDAVHVSLSTISVRLSRLLGESHQQHQQHFVAAPVFGRPSIAEQGKLGDDLKRRIDAASKFVPLDQICLSGQCGFSSTVEGNAVTYDEQLAKLRLIVETARQIWG